MNLALFQDSTYRFLVKRFSEAFHQSSRKKVSSLKKLSVTWEEVEVGR
jgi:hypothetical protein